MAVPTALTSTAPTSTYRRVGSIHSYRRARRMRPRCVASLLVCRSLSKLSIAIAFSSPTLTVRVPSGRAKLNAIGDSGRSVKDSGIVGRGAQREYVDYACADEEGTGSNRGLTANILGAAAISLACQPFAVGAMGLSAAAINGYVGDVDVVQDMRRINADSPSGTSIAFDKQASRLEIAPSSPISAYLPGNLLADDTATIPRGSSVENLLDQMDAVKEKMEANKIDEAELKRRIQDVKESIANAQQEVGGNNDAKVKVTTLEEGEQSNAEKESPATSRADADSKLQEQPAKEAAAAEIASGNAEVGQDVVKKQDREEMGSKSVSEAEQNLGGVVDTTTKEQQAKVEGTTTEKSEQSIAEQDDLALAQRRADADSKLKDLKAREAAAEMARANAELESIEKERQLLIVEQEIIKQQLESARVVVERAEGLEGKIKQLQSEKSTAEAKAQEERDRAAETEKRLVQLENEKTTAEVDARKERERIALIEKQVKKLEKEMLLKDQETTAEKAEYARLAKERERLLEEATKRQVELEGAKFETEQRAEKLEGEVRRLAKEKALSESRARVEKERKDRFEEQILKLERNAAEARIRFKQLQEVDQSEDGIKANSEKQLANGPNSLTSDFNPQAIALAAGTILTLVAVATLLPSFLRFDDDVEDEPSSLPYGLRNSNGASIPGGASNSRFQAESSQEETTSAPAESFEGSRFPRGVGVTTQSESQSPPKGSYGGSGSVTGGSNFSAMESKRNGTFGSLKSQSPFQKSPLKGQMYNKVGRFGSGTGMMKEGAVGIDSKSPGGFPGMPSSPKSGGTSFSRATKSNEKTSAKGFGSMDVKQARGGSFPVSPKMGGGSFGSPKMGMGSSLKGGSMDNKQSSGFGGPSNNQSGAGGFGSGTDMMKGGAGSTDSKAPGGFSGMPSSPKGGGTLFGGATKPNEKTSVKGFGSMDGKQAGGGFPASPKMGGGSFGSPKMAMGSSLKGGSMDNKQSSGFGGLGKKQPGAGGFGSGTGMMKEGASGTDSKSPGGFPGMPSSPKSGGTSFSGATKFNKKTSVEGLGSMDGKQAGGGGFPASPNMGGGSFGSPKTGMGSSLKGGSMDKQSSGFGGPGNKQPSAGGFGSGTGMMKGGAGGMDSKAPGGFPAMPSSPKSGGSPFGGANKSLMDKTSEECFGSMDGKQAGRGGFSASLKMGGGSFGSPKMAMGPSLKGGLMDNKQSSGFGGPGNKQQGAGGFGSGTGMMKGAEIGTDRKAPGGFSGMPSSPKSGGSPFGGADESLMDKTSAKGFGLMDGKQAGGEGFPASPKMGGGSFGSPKMGMGSSLKEGSMDKQSSGFGGPGNKQPGAGGFGSGTGMMKGGAGGMDSKAPGGFPAKPSSPKSGGSPFGAANKSLMDKTSVKGFGSMDGKQAGRGGFSASPKMGGGSFGSPKMAMGPSLKGGLMDNKQSSGFGRPGNKQQGAGGFGPGTGMMKGAAVGTDSKAAGGFSGMPSSPKSGGSSFGGADESLMDKTSAKGFGSMDGKQAGGGGFPGSPKMGGGSFGSSKMGMGSSLKGGSMDKQSSGFGGPGNKQPGAGVFGSGTGMMKEGASGTDSKSSGGFPGMRLPPKSGGSPLGSATKSLMDKTSEEGFGSMDGKQPDGGGFSASPKVGGGSFGSPKMGMGSSLKGGSMDNKQSSGFGGLGNKQPGAGGFGSGTGMMKGAAVGTDSKAPLGFPGMPPSPKSGGSPFGSANKSLMDKTSAKGFGSMDGKQAGGGSFSASPKMGGSSFGSPKMGSGSSLKGGLMDNKQSPGFDGPSNKQPGAGGFGSGTGMMKGAAVGTDRKAPVGFPGMPSSPKSGGSPSGGANKSLMDKTSVEGFGSMDGKQAGGGSFPASPGMGGGSFGSPEMGMGSSLKGGSMDNKQSSGIGGLGKKQPGAGGFGSGTGMMKGAAIGTDSKTPVGFPGMPSSPKSGGTSFSGANKSLMDRASAKGFGSMDGKQAGGGSSSASPKIGGGSFGSPKIGMGSSLKGGSMDNKQSSGFGGPGNKQPSAGGFGSGTGMMKGAAVSTDRKAPGGFPGMPSSPKSGGSPFGSANKSLMDKTSVEGFGSMDGKQAGGGSFPASPGIGGVSFGSPEMGMGSSLKGGSMDNKHSSGFGGPGSKQPGAGGFGSGTGIMKGGVGGRDIYAPGGFSGVPSSPKDGGSSFSGANKSLMDKTAVKGFGSMDGKQVGGGGFPASPGMRKESFGSPEIGMGTSRKGAAMRRPTGSKDPGTSELGFGMPFTAQTASFTRTIMPPSRRAEISSAERGVSSDSTNAFRASTGGGLSSSSNYISAGKGASAVSFDGTSRAASMRSFREGGSGASSRRKLDNASFEDVNAFNPNSFRDGGMDTGPDFFYEFE